MGTNRNDHNENMIAIPALRSGIAILLSGRFRKATGKIKTPIALKTRFERGRTREANLISGNVARWLAATRQLCQLLNEVDLFIENLPLMGTNLPRDPRFNSTSRQIALRRAGSRGGRLGILPSRRTLIVPQRPAY